jgi:hypothetical protein
MEATSSRRLADIVRFGTFELSLRNGEAAQDAGFASRSRSSRCGFSWRCSSGQERSSRARSYAAVCGRKGTFVDFEHSLNAAVRRLRVTLGDDGDVPKIRRDRAQARLSLSCARPSTVIRRA